MNIVRSIVIKVSVLVFLFLLLINSGAYAQYQWPFPISNQQGAVAGSVGEYRYTSRTDTHRFHQGVDLTNGTNHAIHSINAGNVSWNGLESAATSAVIVVSRSGEEVRYFHVRPRLEIKNGAITQVAIGDYIGEMIEANDWPTHVHLEEETTNFLDHNLNPYEDNAPPYFPTTIIPNAVAFYRNGLVKTTTNFAALELNQQIAFDGSQHTLLYEKIDIVAHAIDPRVSSSGAGNGGQMVPSEISWYAVDAKNNAFPTERLRFDGIPSNAAAIPSFHPRSTHPGSPSIHIVTSHPRNTPYDRFWNSRLRAGQTEAWSVTNRPASLDARINAEAAYSDGKYTLRFNAFDVDYNNDPNQSAQQREVKVIIDNFRPFIKEIIVRRGTELGRLSYHGSWEWDASSGVISHNEITQDDVAPGENIWIKIVASEPIQNLKYNFQAADGTTYWDIDSPLPNSNNTEFVILHPPIATAGMQQIRIQATDLAGNSLQSDVKQIPIRLSNGTWSPASTSTGIDVNGHFNVGSYICSTGAGGRKGTTSRISSTACLYAEFSLDKTTPAINEAVKITPVTSGNGVLTYSWNFGSGATPATSTSSGPQIVAYSSSGPKNVTLKLCDNSGTCITETKTSVVNVGAPPSQLTVDFSANRLGANTGDNIQLTSTITGAVGTVSYAWNFGDGLSLGQFSDVNPLVAYNTPGNKTVQLTVTDNNGSVTVVKNNYLLINSLAFNVGVTITGCGPTTTSGTATFSKIVTGGNGEPYDTYLWDFGDGTTSTSSASTVSHTYKKYGKYTVRLRVCDETGCGIAESVNCVDVPTSVESSTLAASFLINDLPVYGPIQEVGLNTPVKFTSSTTGGGDANTFKYSWKFDYSLYDATNGTSATPNTGYTVGPKAQEVVYKTIGNKSVILSVDNGSIARGTPFQEVLKVVTGRGSGTCMATIGNVTISSTCWSASAKPKFTIPVSTTNCPVAKTEVLHWVTPDKAYVLPNGVLDFSSYSAGDIPSFPFTSDFSFAVYQYDGVNYNRIGYKRQRFTIYGPVMANAGLDQQICYGASVPIGPAQPENKLYKWSSTTSPLNLLSRTDIPNPTVNALQKGTLKYKMTVTDQASGCTSSDEVILTVNKPEVQPNTFFVKLGISSPLNVAVTGGFGNNVYQWSPADKLSNASLPTPNFTSSSEGNFNYIVTVTDKLGCSGLSQVFVNASSSPASLVAKAESFSRISLVWVDRSSNESSFVIQRSIDGGAFTDYTSVAANVTKFDDINIVKESTYTYRVAAKIGSSISGFTNEAGINTGSLPQFSLASETLNAVGDFDNDRDMDYVKLSSTVAEIYINNSGSFVLTQSLSLPTPPTSAVILSFRTIVGDFDNDNDNDVYIIPYSQGRYTAMLLKNSSGVFSLTTDNLNAQTISIPNFYPFDYGNDNNLDLLIDFLWPTGSNNFFINQNNGAASFTTLTTQLPTAYSLSNDFMNDFPGTSFGLSDIDNDGDEDIVVPNSGQTLNSFINDGGFLQSNSNLIYTGCCNGEGTIEFGDFNSDRKKDILHISPTASVLLKNTGSFPFENTNLNIPKFTKGISKFGDYDSDGDLDLFVSGNTTATTTQHSVYENNAGSFILKYTVAGQLVDWIDFDADGDLDLIGFGGKLYKNNNGQGKPKVNAVPTAPTNLCAYYSGDNEVTFSWGASTDTETPSAGLTYNLFVKQNGVFIMSPLSDLATGFRKIQKRGNVDLNTSWTLKLVGGGNIEWGVQAVDNTYMGSTFGSNSLAAQNSFCDDIVSVVFLNRPEITLPYNCPSNIVTVKNGASLRLQAPGNIKLLPGFTVQPGGTFKAKNGQYSPNQSPCVDGSNGRLLSELDSETKEEAAYLSISPNPTKGPLDLEVDFGRPEDNIVVEVINGNGVSILSKRYGRQQYIRDQLDISGSNSGLYLVKILSGNRILFRKIIKI